MHTGLSEIESFLSHGDHSLAVRRLLDTALDTGDRPLIRKSISLSKEYRQGDASFPEKAEHLINELGSVSTGMPEHASETLIQASGITKYYTKGNFSLSPINMHVATGDVVGIVGPNGNGKTTLLRCLAGQLATNDGTIRYPLLKEPDHYDIKHHVAFIPQRIDRWYGLLKDNLHFSVSISGIHGAENELMVDFMLERLGLSTYAHLNWNQISSGYRTRFEIARILLQKPSLLILDEPLANLDINAQQTILTDLRYMAKSTRHPMGVLLSSQQLHEVEKVADAVVMISNGKCVFQTGDTDPEALITHTIELETTAERDTILKAMSEPGIQIRYNGGFYTLHSVTLDPQQMIAKLVQSGIPVTYFRDITHSTKRFFLQ